MKISPVPSWANPDSKQKTESLGPLGKKRMETIDEEITEGAFGYLDKAAKSDKPFFLWWNSTRMHINTYLKPASDHTSVPASTSSPRSCSGDM
jgi:arylsulfatase